MTESQIEQAEKDAEKDAELLLLLLLLSKNTVFRADVGRFYYKGKSVSITQIRSYLNRIERKMGSRMQRLTTDLEKKRITLANWQREFERSVTSSHVLAGALALGGIAAAVRNADVQARIDSELRYADGFAKDIKEKKPSTPKIKSRAKSYLIAATITYGILEMKARDLIGIQTECRRIRRASESCPGCVEWAYRWLPIGQMPLIGSLQCKSRCRCYLEYR